MKLRSIFIVMMSAVCGCKSPDHIKPEIADIAESVYAAGVIKAKNQYSVSPTVSGVVTDVWVTEGDLLQVGSPIVSISNKPARITRENAYLRATYENRETNKDKLTDLQNHLTMALEKCKNDSLLFVRQKKLWDEGIGTKVQVEQKQLAWENSKTERSSAKINYDILDRQLRFLSKQYKNDHLLSIEAEKEYTITSESNGKAYAVLKKQGEMATPASPVAIIGDAERFIIELQIDEYDIVKVKTGQRVFVTMDSYKGKNFEAVITKLYPLMNEQTKLFVAEAVFRTDPPILYPNLTVQGNILIHYKKNAVLIPRSYMLNDSTVKVGKNKIKKVITGLKDYNKVEILHGLSLKDDLYKPE